MQIKIYVYFLLSICGLFERVASAAWYHTTILMVAPVLRTRTKGSFHAGTLDAVVVIIVIVVDEG